MISAKPTHGNAQIVCILLVIAITLLQSGSISTRSAQAHSGATGVVKERMETMKSIANAMKRVASMQNKEHFDPIVVWQAMRQIEEKAEKISHQYPEGEFSQPTEALPNIHQEWDSFTALASDLRTYARELREFSEEAVSFSDINEKFLRVGSTCKSCHEKFRLKQQ